MLPCVIKILFDILNSPLPTICTNSDHDTLSGVKDRKSLKLPADKQLFMAVKTTSGKYKFVRNVKYDSGAPSSKPPFTVDSKGVDILEAGEADEFNVVLGHFGDILWYCAGRLKNPAVRVHWHKGILDRKSHPKIFRPSNFDADTISCGLTGSSKPYNLPTTEFTPDMCLVCCALGNAFQFVLRDTEGGRLTRYLPGDISSFRGSLKQSCDLLQLMMGLPAEGPASILDSLAPQLGRPLKYLLKGAAAPLGPHIDNSCCLACSMAYALLTGLAKAPPGHGRGIHRPVTHNHQHADAEEKKPAFCMVKNGVLTTSKGYIPPQIDLSSQDGAQYVGSHLLLLTTDLFSCPPDIWVHALVKYWHKKYRVLFAHLYEHSPSLDDGANALLEGSITPEEFQRLVEAEKNRLSCLERSRQWIFPSTCRHILEIGRAHV